MYWFMIESTDFVLVLGRYHELFSSSTYYRFRRKRPHLGIFPSKGLQCGIHLKEKEGPIELPLPLKTTPSTRASAPTS